MERNGENEGEAMGNCHLEKELVVKGLVTSGLGEGKFITSLDWVQEQCLAKFGLVPVPGTFNVRILPEEAPRLEVLDHYRGVKILPSSPVFAVAKCFAVQLGGIKGVLLRPMLEDYPRDLLEIVAEINIREALGLENGGLVEVCVQLMDIPEISKG